jgi:pentatricopeptide repeat protein
MNKFSQTKRLTTLLSVSTVTQKSNQSKATIPRFDNNAFYHYINLSLLTHTLLLLYFTDAWAKSAVPDGTQAAERLLAKMINNPRLEPSSITYNAVLDSHAHSSDPDSLIRMNKIWQHMQKLADAGSTKIRPNLRTVNMILTACVRKAEMMREQDEKMGCARQAQVILDDIKERAKDGNSDLTPDVMTYSIVMDAYARVGSPEAALQAEALMMELKQAFLDTGDVRKQPNFRTYTTLIGAWSRTPDKSAARRAEALVAEMEAVYAKRMAEGRPLGNGEETTKPNARTFTAVIHALSRSHDNDKSKRVLKLLMKMREQAKTDPDCAPLLNTYNQGTLYHGVVG